MPRSLVSIVRTGASARDEVAAAVRRAVALAGGLGEAARPGALVVLKPNVVAPPPTPNCGATTNPDVVRALADLVVEHGAWPVIAEASAVGVDTELAFAAAGYQQLRDEGYEVVDLKRTPIAEVEVRGGRLLTSFTTYELIARADAIVSVPVMKTHDQAEVTLSLKNLKGVLTDKEKRRLHREGVFDGVLDLVSTLRPAFALVDGTYCQEGLGPIYGRPVEMDLLVASRDPVAADAVAGRVMDFTPDEVLLTRFAAERGLGLAAPEQIEVVGEPVERVRRRFLRMVEDHQYDVPGLRIVHAEGTCTGCRNTVVSCLYDLRSAGQLAMAEGLTILTSDAPTPADCDPAMLVTVGKCVPPERRSARYAPGCPPNNVWIVQQILGERGEARRTYATGDNVGEE
jgi:uncharacterized protein (DUF362 family)